MLSLHIRVILPILYICFYGEKKKIIWIVLLSGAMCSLEMAWGRGGVGGGGVGRGSLDKSEYQVNSFLITQRKHTLWVLIRSASVRCF